MNFKKLCKENTYRKFYFDVSDINVFYQYTGVLLFKTNKFLDYHQLAFSI